MALVVFLAKLQLDFAVWEKVPILKWSAAMESSSSFETWCINMFEFARVVLHNLKNLWNIQCNQLIIFLLPHSIFFSIFKNVISTTTIKLEIHALFLQNNMYIFFLTYTWIFYKSRHNEKSTHRICKLLVFASLLVPPFCCAANFFRNAPEINFETKN